MKKVFLLLGMIIFSFSVFAQELSPGLQAKNDGNAAFKEKDYVSAIKHWEKYLNSDEEGVENDVNTMLLYLKSFKYAGNNFMKKKNYAQAYDYYKNYIEKGDEEAKTDGKTFYYMAYCAKKMDKPDLAITHYQKSIELDYRPDMCKLYIADIYKDMGKDEDMKQLLVAAIEEHPDSKYIDKMASMLTKPMLQEASVPFNKANELAKEASTGSPNEYMQKMARAVSKFEEAIPLFDKVLKYDPKNDTALKYKKVCTDNINQFEEYKASLDK
ncbi:MAG: tetratricopeptide repeat protein [Prolixibacteraceae bacterium]|nr:tetratricopeptide repeat protein [Prolixibacteraceae bacterium]